MKKSKLKEFADKTVVELKNQLKTVRLDISRLEIEINSKRLKDVALIGKKRREVAQILTFITQKETKS